MQEKCDIVYRENFGELIIIENDIPIQYLIKVDVDRIKALVTTSKFEKIDDIEYRCIECKREYLTLSEIKNDPARDELFQWLAHGVFGVPLKYGK